jgi:hypothetical protein
MKMLNATKWNHTTYRPNRKRTRELEKELLARKPNERTTFIEVQHYLDFKYGTSRIAITLPDKSTAKLVVGADGRVYFEVPING